VETRTEASPDRAILIAAMFSAATLVAQQVAGKATRDALFLSSFHVRSLPLIMMGSAAVSVLAVFGFSRAFTAHSPGRVLPPALALSALLLLAEWGVNAVHPRLCAVLVYLHMAFFGATLASGFWSLINERFDPYTAKRVVRRVGLGASVGGALGGLLAWAASGWVSVPAMLGVMAGLNAACLVGVWRLRSPRPSSAAAASRPSPLAGLVVLRENRYLRDLGLFMALAATIEALLDFGLGSEITAALGPGGGQARSADLISFFALFHAGVGIIALGAQVLFARRSLETLGLAGTAAVRSAAVSVTGIVGAFVPGLASAVLARGSEAILRNSLFRTGYELLYTPLPEAQKRATKAIVDVGFDKLGTILGSGITLAVASLGHDFSSRIVFGLAGAGGVVSLVLCRRLHGGYVDALAESLRTGAVRLEASDVADSTTLYTLTQATVAEDRATLLRQLQEFRVGEPRSSTPDTASPQSDPVAQAVADLRSGNPGATRRVLSRDDSLDPGVAAHAIPLLAHNDLFLDVLRALRKSAPRITGLLIDVLLDPGASPAVRRRIPRVLIACATQRSVDGLLQGLGEGSFEIRLGCAAALNRLLERPSGLHVSTRRVYGAVTLELKRRAGPESGPPEKVLEYVFHLLGLVLERQPLRIAHRALRSQDSLRGTALEYLENVLPDDVRDALWAFLGMRRGRPTQTRSRQEVVAELVQAAVVEGLRRPAPASDGSEED
jgi:AAA family ATP:ADP antiporter